MKLKNLFCVFLHLLLVPCLQSGELIRPLFKHYSPDQGLSHSGIRRIHQDNAGFMWIGTFDGINKYDGYRFKIYRHVEGDSASLPSNYCTAISEDRQGKLWVGTSGGLRLYNPMIDKFELPPQWVGSNIQLKSTYVETILADHNGNIWMGTDHDGLILYEARTGAYTHFLHDPQNPASLSHDHVTALFEDEHHTLLAGIWTGDLQCYNPTTGEFEYLMKKEPGGLPRIIWSIVGEDDKIWVSTLGDGLYEFTHTSDGEYKPTGHLRHDPAQSNSISGDNVLALCTDGRGGLWIGTENHGINYFDIKTKTIRRFLADSFDDRSLSQNSVWQIYRDVTNNIWIGTYAGGVSFLASSQKRFHHFRQHPNGLSHNIVSSFTQDNEGTIWIGLDGGGINSFDPETEEFRTYNSENSTLTTDAVLAVFSDSKNRLWVGTWAGGLYRRDKPQDIFTHYTVKNSALSSDNVTGLAEDLQGNLWAATCWGGVCAIKPDDMSFTVYNTSNSSISHNQARCVFVDYAGNVWVGTDDGFNRFIPEINDFQVVSLSEPGTTPLSGNAINYINQSRDSLLWVGTLRGIYEFNAETGQTTRYGIDDGLSNATINGIIEDQDGHIWLSTNGGLSKFNRKQGSFTNYGIWDGLQSTNFYRCAALKTKDNAILFGGIDGFNMFDSRKGELNPYIPPIVITNFEIFNKPVDIAAADSPLKQDISVASEVDLSYRHSVFSFEFAALNYIDAEKNQYAYRLKGFENDWNYVGTKRAATYTNLDPGEYLFQVKGSNNDGIWNENGVSIVLTIHPPFWKTWWAYLIYVLFLSGVLFAIMSHFIGKERLESALRLEHLELEKMHELDQLKSRFFANVSHEFRAPLTLMLGPLDTLLKSNLLSVSIKQKLALVYNSGRRLLRMSNQLLDFHKLEAEELSLDLAKGDLVRFVRNIFLTFRKQSSQTSIRFHFETNRKYLHTWFDPHKIDIILHNLISNAVKFSPDGGEITVEITSGEPSADFELSDHLKNLSECASEYARISVKDTGIGIAEKHFKNIFDRFYQVSSATQFRGSGIGLALTLELVRLYCGDILVRSIEGQGSCFTVFIPLDRDYLIGRQCVGAISHKGIDDLFNQEERDYSSNGRTDSKVSSGAHSRNNTETPLILIAEDDPEMRNYIDNELSKDFRTVAVTEGKEALYQALEKIPDLIIADMVMPNMTGIELCRNVKQDQRTNHIPLIMLTARATDKHRIKGLESGADAFITKPFNMDVLCANVNSLLDTRAKLRTKYSKNLRFRQAKRGEENSDEKFLQRLADIVEENLDNFDFHADDLSKAIGIGRVQLYRKVKNLTNQTVHEFIRTIRFQFALQLLESKRMTITEIAYETGFQDVTYFARCFRKHFGKSPSEYRQKKIRSTSE